MRVRTGYERAIAHRTSKVFAGVSKKDGIVTLVDQENQMVEVTYTDKTKEVFPFGEEYVEFEGMNFTQALVAKVTQGQKVKNGDIITYNPGFFTEDEKSGQVDFSLGILAKVAFLETDSTLEDSTEISPELGEKLTIRPANSRVITLTKKSFVHMSAKVGDMITATDPLILFEEDTIGDVPILNTSDPETLEMLTRINQDAPKAKYTGKVVKIEAYYSCPISEMHPSLAAIVRSAGVRQNKRSKIAQGTKDESLYVPSAPLPVGSRYKGVIFEEDTVVLIYNIQEKIPAGSGDKLVFANQLKCTVMGTFPKTITTESGLVVDALSSTSAVANRIVLSLLYHGYTSRILEKVQQNVVDKYFSK